MNKIYISGIGPGSSQYLTPQALESIKQADVIVGYSYYIDLLGSLVDGKEVISTGMKKEHARAEQAFTQALQGKTVAVISSGDAGVYGMASLMLEMKTDLGYNTELEVVPGISAMFAAAAKMGAPLGHDFCSISMSDLLTPWNTIENRIKAAASADFVTAVYNPVSHDRFWQLMRLKEIFLESRSPDTPVGIARQIGREDENVTIIPLSELKADMADMFTVLIIGNSQSRNENGCFFTPRGYHTKVTDNENQPGREIMNESFRLILQELGDHKLPLEKLWVALHTIHTTADTGMAKLLELTPGIVEQLHKLFYSGQPPVIVTDVTMVGSGIRKALLGKTGIDVVCYLNDPRVAELAREKRITRTQAGIRLAAEEYPNAVYVFGNAPTALMELVKLIRKGNSHPVGVIAAPVGFVNVRESKWQLKHGCPDVPYILIEGRKGGSNVAATIVNAILSWDDAVSINPGEGL